MNKPFAKVKFVRFLIWLCVPTIIYIFLRRIFGFFKNTSWATLKCGQFNAVVGMAALAILVQYE